MAETRVGVNAVLSRWCERARTSFPGDVGEAICYSLAAPGKRLRPALAIAAFSELNGTGDPTELAASLEAVHTYSLVHDDLPCMDDDDLRRGRSTTHRKFGVPVATEAAFRMVPLAGDMLRAGATQLGLPPQLIRDVSRELFRAAGATGMVGGQIRDLEAEGKSVTLEELIEIHLAKTGALITASVAMGAMAAGANEAILLAVRAYGQEIGLAFQIVDDVLDATGTSGALGKTAGKDRRQDKATFPSLMGVDAAGQEAERRVRKAIGHLASAGINSGLLTGLASFITSRRS